MKIEPKEYQRLASDDIVQTLFNDHKKFQREKYLLKAPTGSGKTLITTLSLNAISEKVKLGSTRNKWTYIFLAPSKGELAYQGYKSLVNFKENHEIGTELKYNFVGSIDTKNKQKAFPYSEFEPGNLYFIPWQKIVSKSNIWTRKKSELRTLWDTVKETIKNNTNIIFVLDEAHEGDLISDITPEEREYINSADETKYNQKQILVKRKLILDEISGMFEKRNNIVKKIFITATPDKKHVPNKTISISEPQEESIVKGSIIKNAGISQNQEWDDLNNGDSKYIKLLLGSAVKKQNEIKREMINNNEVDSSLKNPLMLVQMNMDKKEKHNDWKYVAELLSNEQKLFGKDLENVEVYSKAEIGIWLSEYKADANGKPLTKEEIVSNDSRIKVLIFKNAISTGWDAPRSNMLVSTREGGKTDFKIQTIGRIMRNPHLRKFNNILIDNAYVYFAETKENIKAVNEVLKTETLEVIRIDKQDDKTVLDIEIPIRKLKDWVTELSLFSSFTNGLTKVWSEFIIDLPSELKDNYRDSYKEGLTDILKNIKVSVVKDKFFTEGRLLLTDDSVGIKNTGPSVKLETALKTNQVIYRLENHLTGIGERLNNWIDTLYEDVFKHKGITYRKYLTAMTGGVFKEVITSAYHYAMNDNSETVWVKQSTKLSNIFPSDMIAKDTAGFYSPDKKELIDKSNYYKFALSQNEKEKSEVSNWEYEFYNWVLENNEKMDSELEFIYWNKFSKKSDGKSINFSYNKNEYVAGEFHPDFILKTKNTVYILDPKDLTRSEDAKNKLKGLRVAIDMMNDRSSEVIYKGGLITKFEDEFVIVTNEEEIEPLINGKVSLKKYLNDFIKDSTW